MTVRATFQDLVDVMHKLRAPGGCPWDREQSLQTLRQYILEEAYEVVDAIDNDDGGGTGDKLADEAGDLLFQVVFIAELAAELGWFQISDVIAGIHGKLVRRHPHVFGDVQVASAQEVLRNWDAIKAVERQDDHVSDEPLSALDGVPIVLPALARAEKLGRRAARSGFDWSDAESVVDKIAEEIDEVRAAIRDNDRDGVARELGDLLFAAAQLARYLEVPAEDAAREACRTFEARFRHLEARLREDGRTPKDADGEELDRLWEEAKRALRD